MAPKYFCYVWLLLPAVTCFLLAAFLGSLTDALVVLVFLACAAIGLPTLIRRSDQRRQRLYDGWRVGNLPRRRTTAKKWKQVSIRGTLILTTLVAIAISYLQKDSPIGGLLLGLGFVSAGILIGIDYEPRGIGVWYGRPFAAMVGVTISIVSFAIFLTAVRVVVSHSWPNQWFWDSIGRLSLLWACFGLPVGIAVGLWKAGQPFRWQPSLSPFAKPIHIGPTNPTNHRASHPPTIKDRRRVATALTWFDLIPATALSLLLHVTVISLQTGMFDVGAKTESAEATESTKEIEIIATFADEVSEPDAVAVQIEPAEDDLAVDETEMTAAPEETVEAIEEDDAGDVPRKLADMEEPSEIIADSGQGTVGAAASEEFEIPLDGRTVHVRTRLANYKMTGVNTLKLISDGKRVRVDVDATDVMSAVELPLKYMSIEFETPDNANEKLLATRPFVNVGSGINPRRPAVGEAKIEIRNARVGARGWTPPPIRNMAQQLATRTPNRFEERPTNTQPKPASQTSLVNADGGEIGNETPPKGLYLEGRCPVELVENSKWKNGRETLNLEHDGWTIMFSDAANLAKFQQEPEKYLPVFNGLDLVAARDQSVAALGSRRFGVLYNDKGTQPNRIYLFSNVGNRNKFESAPDKYVAFLKSSKANSLARSSVSAAVAKRQTRSQTQSTANAGLMGRNLLKNGDFEVPRVGYGWTDMETGGGEFAWTITKRRVEMKAGFWDGISERGARRSNRALATRRAGGMTRGSYREDGDQSVDMDYGAKMHQVVSTIPGLTYQVSFWYSHNPDGGNRAASGFIRVVGRKKLLEEKVTHNAASTLTDMKFKQFVGRFQADGSKSRIEFESLQPSVFGLVIDDVRVSEWTK